MGDKTSLYHVLLMAKLIAVCLAALLCIFGVMAAPSLNYAHYPNLLTGFQSHICSYRPQVNQYGCSYWCQSTFTRQYYVAAAHKRSSWLATGVWAALITSTTTTLTTHTWDKPLVKEIQPLQPMWPYTLG